ncbi:geranylgeranylglyceryl/heptaprenylglyceryl phosphate synthase [Candidatus Micrarchaeota archaeon]|nr:geranylgeranylglyceryl/heptaprenylglyceryl phosphate synthase [Candidatus Micrarchaeota archaeon]
MKKIEKYIKEELSKKGALFFGVIDPVDYKDLNSCIITAKKTADAGADILLLGGSIGVQGEILDNVTKGIKEKTNTPVVLFPGNIGTVTPYADAMYFMSLLNSRNAYWISQAQTLAAPMIKQYKIETIPVGYLIVEPGGTAGWVGDVNLIPRARPKIAAGLAMAAELSGSAMVITDTGSNPETGHVPLDMIQIVSQSIDVPYIVAGGIKTPEHAKNVIKAGADIIQVGTGLEDSKNIEEYVKKMIKSVREEGKKRV